MILLSFETSQAARERAKAEGNTKPDDLIPIYRKLTQIDPSGRETSTHARYVRILTLLTAPHIEVQISGRRLR